MSTIAIAVGGAMGALMRFWVSSGLYALLGREFPYGTLFVNTIGCALMGFLYIIISEHFANTHWQAVLMIGFLGAFTTFSTFSLETLHLISAGQQGKALLNIFLSITFCLSATWLGIVLAKQIA